MPDKVRIQIPATTANLGPGFDSLGIALRLRNTVTVTRSETDPTESMIADAGAAFFGAAGVGKFGFGWKIGGDVPRSRGLGSSVTVRLGILHGLNALAGYPLNDADLYRLCVRLEGHPDNAAPAAFGGFAVCRPDGAHQRFAVSSRLSFVLLIPAFEVRTGDARRVLPDSVSLRDAAASLGYAASIAVAFASRNYEMLRGAFVDHLHQPHRARLVPGLDAVIGAGVAAGALGGWLSGSGSTVACVTTEDPERVAKAMLGAFDQSDAAVVTTKADNSGVRKLSN